MDEPIAYVTGTYGGMFLVAPLNPAMVLPVGMALYTAPSAAQPAQEPVARYIGEGSQGSLVQLYDDVKKGTDFYATPPKREWEEWNAALDEAAARIGEIKGFGQATQDSFAVYIKGLKR